MTPVLYKATRPDGTDFRTGTVDYAAALASGEPARWQPPYGAGRGRMVRDDPATYLSASAEPGEVLTGGSWPCRLFRVEPAGRMTRSGAHPFKRCARAWHVVEELPAHVALGPNGEAVAALITRAAAITPAQARALGAATDAAGDAAGDAARDAAGDAAGDAARYAARDAAGDAARDAAGDAARDAYAAGDAASVAARALVVADLITDDHFRILHGPWQTVMGDETAGSA
jgi:hypothetical protein